MKQIGRKLTLALLVFLSFALMLCGFVSLGNGFEAGAADGATETQTVSSGWYELKYSKDSLEFRLSDSFGTYLDANREEAKELVNGVVAAVKEIVMQSILQGNEDDPAAHIATVALYASTPGGVELPGYSGDVENLLNNNELLKQFKDYVEERLGQPDEFQKFVDGEYKALLDYAVGTYVENQVSKGEDLQDVLGKVQKVMNEVVDNAFNAAKDAVGSMSHEQQAEFDVEKWETQKNEVVQESVTTVKANGGKAPTITMEQLVAAFSGISVNGNEIYSKTNGFSKAGLKSLLSLIPRPGEIAEMGQAELRNLIEADIMVKTTFGDIGFHLTFGFFGDTTHIQDAARVIAEHIDVSLSGNDLSVNVRVPEAFSDLFLKLTETTQISDSLKNKIFSLFGKTAQDIFDKAESYSYDDLITYIKGIDFQKWFNNFLNGDFIDTYFNRYLESVFGVRIEKSDIDRVINAFSRRAQQLANKGWTYDEATEFLRDIPVVKSLIARLDNTAVEKLVNKFLGVVNRIDWTKYDANTVRDIVANSKTFNSKIVSYIEKFENTVGLDRINDLYEKFKGYAEKLFGYLPQNVKDGALVDLYDGNNHYSHKGSYTIDLEKVFNKVSSVLNNHGFESVADLVDKAKTLLGEDTVYTVDLDLKAEFPGVYKVEYIVGGEAVREGFLPEGATVERFARPEYVEENGKQYEVLYWIDEKGETADTMPAKDAKFYAVTEFELTGTVNGAAAAPIKAEYDEDTFYELKVNADGVPYARYTYKWSFLPTGGDEPETLEVDGDTYTVQNVAQSGTYTVEVTEYVLDDDIGGYKKSYESFEVNIEKKEVKAGISWLIDGTAIPENAVYYNATAHTVTADVDLTDKDGEDVSTDLFEKYTPTGEVSEINAGVYTASLTIKLTEDASANYTFLVEEEAVSQYTGEYAWKILKSELKILSVTFQYDDKDLETGWKTPYQKDGYTISYIVAFKLNGEEVEGEVTDYFNVTAENLTETEVNSYAGKLTFAAKNENYTLTGDSVFTFSWTIEKAKIDLTEADFTVMIDGEAKPTIEYDEQAHTATIAFGKAADYEGILTFESEQNKKTDAGANYEATGLLTLIDTEHYTLKYEGEEVTAEQEIKLTWEITKKAIAAPAAWNATFTKTYGEALTESEFQTYTYEEKYYTVAYSYKKDGDTIAFNEIGDIGEYTIVVTVTLVSNNYVVTGEDQPPFERTATLTIEGIEYNLAGAKIAGIDGLTYNGTDFFAGIKVDLSATNIPVDKQATVLGFLKLTVNDQATIEVKNAGTYTVKVTPDEAALTAAGTKLNNLPVDFNGKEFTVAKATITISVTWTPTTFTDNGKEQTITPTPAITPDSCKDYVTMNVTGNTSKEAGKTLTATATFTLKSEYIDNYMLAGGTLNTEKTVATFTQSWTITPNVYDADAEVGKLGSDVVVTLKNGSLSKDYHVVITKNENFTVDKAKLEALFKGEKVNPSNFSYDIKLVDESGATVPVPQGVTFTITINTLPKLAGTMTVVHIHNGTYITTDAAAEGGKITLTIGDFSDFLIVGHKTLGFFEQEMFGMPMWLLILLIVVAVLLLIALIVVIILIARIKLAKEEKAEEEAKEETAEETPTETKQEETVEETAEEPVEEVAEEATEEATEEEAVEEAAEEIAEEPAEEAVEEATEEEPVAAIAAAPTEEAAEEEPAVEESEEEPKPAADLLAAAGLDRPAEEEEVIAPEDEVMTILDRSFTARLTQAESELQKLYSELKNYILSYKYVRSRVSWKYDTFNKGRNKIAKFQFKGKSLFLYFAIDPKEVDARYHAKDVSKTKKYADVPTKLKIRNARTAKYAKAIIDLVMQKLGLTQGELPTTDYTLPYKSNEQLISEGQIKEKQVPAPVFWNMDASDVIENAPALPEVEIESYSGSENEPEAEDTEEAIEDEEAVETPAEAEAPVEEAPAEEVEEAPVEEAEEAPVEEAEEAPAEAAEEAPAEAAEEAPVEEVEAQETEEAAEAPAEETETQEAEAPAEKDE